ncbi:MAG: HAMP domain-containing sensor histidine kinase [Acidimicrobiales bacterium]
MTDGGDQSGDAPPAAPADEIDRRRVSLLIDASHGPIVALAAAAVVAALVYHEDPRGTVIWVIVRVLVSVGMIVEFQRLQRIVPDQPTRALRRFAWAAAAGSAAWGLLPVLVRPDEAEWQAMLLFATIGSLSVVAAGYTPDRRVFVAGAVPNLAIALVAFATFDGRFATVLCLALLLSAVYAVVIFVEGNRSLEAVFEADVRGHQLVQQLEANRADLREINERLHTLVDRQSMTLEERDALIAAVSHDLRSPLAAMSLMAETLAVRGDMMTDEQRQSMLARISGDAKHAAEVLADLASTQRLRAQDVLATRGEIDLPTLLRDVVNAHPTEQHQLSVGPIELDGRPVVADPVLVRRILDNLLGNARKHTPIGSRIVVGACRSGGEVLVHVDDDGPGLPDGLRESVFDAYVRGTSATTRPGSGVGLFLVRTFAQLHGGRAWWEPSALGGSRFVVSLPQEQSHQPSHQQ